MQQTRETDVNDNSEAAGKEPRPSRVSPQDEAIDATLRHRSLQAQIGAQLRAIFADVANAPVPERFQELLRTLEERERAK